MTPGQSVRKPPTLPQNAGLDLVQPIPFSLLNKLSTIKDETAMEAGFILRRFATLFSRVSDNKKVRHEKKLKVDCGRFDRRLPTRKIAESCWKSFFRALHEGLPSGKEFAG